MKFNQQQRQYAAWGLVAVLLTALAVVLGISYPVPAAPWESVTQRPGGEIGVQQRERIAILASQDCLLRNGADIRLYSDDLASQTLHLDGSAGAIDAEGALAVGGDITLENGETVANSPDGYVTITAPDGVTMSVTAPGGLYVSGPIQGRVPIAAITGTQTASVYDAGSWYTSDDATAMVTMTVSAITETGWIAYLMPTDQDICIVPAATATINDCSAGRGAWITTGEVGVATVIYTGNDHWEVLVTGNYFSCGSSVGLCDQQQ